MKNQTKMFFLTLWKYVKAYWKYALALVIGVFGLLFFAKKAPSLADSLKKISLSHEQELKDIAKAREEESAQHEANKKSYDERLDVIKKEYEQKNEELSDKKKKEIDKILKSSGSDPIKLAEELSAATGFKIILPENSTSE